MCDCDMVGALRGRDIAWLCVGAWRCVWCVFGLLFNILCLPQNHQTPVTDLDFNLLELQTRSPDAADTPAVYVRCT